MTSLRCRTQYIHSFCCRHAKYSDAKFVASRPSPTKPNHTCSLDTVTSHQSAYRLCKKRYKRSPISFGNNPTWRSCNTYIRLTILFLIFSRHWTGRDAVHAASSTAMSNKCRYIVPRNISGLIQEAGEGQPQAMLSLNMSCHG